jgi:hypothetical protein
MTDFELVTAADVQRMQGLAQRVTAMNGTFTRLTRRRAVRNVRRGGVCAGRRSAAAGYACGRGCGP